MKILWLWFLSLFSSSKKQLNPFDNAVISLIKDEKLYQKEPSERNEKIAKREAKERIKFDKMFRRGSRSFNLYAKKSIQIAIESATFYPIKIVQAQLSLDYIPFNSFAASFVEEAKSLGITCELIHNRISIDYESFAAYHAKILADQNDPVKTITISAYR